MRQKIAHSLGLNYEEISIFPDEEIASIREKKIKKFDFLENDDYFICFYDCIFDINSLKINEKTKLILVFFSALSQIYLSRENLKKSI